MSVRGDNPRALARGLSPIQTQKTYNNCVCTFRIARNLTFNIELFNIGINHDFKHKNLLDPKGGVETQVNKSQGA